MGKVLGPVTYEQIQRDIEVGIVTKEMWVKDESGGQWMPVGASPFGPLVQLAPRTDLLRDMGGAEGERFLVHVIEKGVTRGVLFGSLRAMLVLFLAGLALGVVLIFIRAASVR